MPTTYQTYTLESVYRCPKVKRQLLPGGQVDPRADGRQALRGLIHHSADANSHHDIGDRRERRQVLQIPDHTRQQDGNYDQDHVNGQVYVYLKLVANLVVEQ